MALLRNEYLSENLFFLSYAPSLELIRMMDIGFIKPFPTKSQTKVKAVASLQGELIPSVLLKSFRDSLKTGAILVLTPNKSYGLAISCAQCRNIANCDCGGRLSKSSKNSPPACTICSKIYPEWRCSYCGKERIFVLGRGVEWIAEEFGRTFPNSIIQIATSDHQLSGPFKKGSIVISTLGSVPDADFTCTVFLDGLILGKDLRVEERTSNILLKYGAFSSGNAMLIMPPSSPFVALLHKGNPFPLLLKVLHERSQLTLPPQYRVARLSLPHNELSLLMSGLKSAMRQNRFPKDSKIYSNNVEQLTIFFPISEGAKATDFLYQLQRRRSAANKPLLKMRIDPYLLG